MHLRAIIFATCSLIVTATSHFETAYEWKYVDYVWPSKAKRQEAIRNGHYDIKEPMPMDFAVSQDGRTFMTISSVKGVPARLGVVTNKVEAESGPLVQPYPNWNWFDYENCDAIIQPLRIEVDECNRLWVLDPADPRLGPTRKCHPKLMVFNLWTNTLISNIVLPENIAANAKTNQSLMAALKVETHGQFCQDTTVYMADALGNALVIWDGKLLHRIEDSSFEPQKEAMNLTIGSEHSFQPVGILGLDISPKTYPGEPQYLFYRPMASFDLFAVGINDLKNGIPGHTIRYVGEKHVLTSQSIAHAFSSEGTLFLGATTETALVCWNRYRHLSKENIITVAQDSVRLQYADGIKVIPENIFGEEEVWVISNRLLHHQHRELWNVKEINYRILKSPVKKLIAGTKCETPAKTPMLLSGIIQNSWSMHFG